jgi:hypothetical protein
MSIEGIIILICLTVSTVCTIIAFFLINGTPSVNPDDGRRCGGGDLWG